MANSDVIELISLASLSESDVRLLREDNCIEAKKAKDKLPDSLWDTYSAFANSDGGLILLGVSENSRRMQKSSNGIFGILSMTVPRSTPQYFPTKML